MDRSCDRCVNYKAYSYFEHSITLNHGTIHYLQEQFDKLKNSHEEAQKRIENFEAMLKRIEDFDATMKQIDANVDKFKKAAAKLREKTQED